MALIKVTAADKYFGLCVKERVNYICELCHTQYQRGDKGLHCSHFFGRRHKSTRHDPNNAFAHCFPCHQALGSNPLGFTNWARQALGSEVFEELSSAHNKIIKYSKSIDKEIAAHYKKEHERMLKKRDGGGAGRIEFEGFRHDF